MCCCRDQWRPTILPLPSYSIQTEARVLPPVPGLLLRCVCALLGRVALQFGEYAAHPVFLSSMRLLEAAGLRTGAKLWGRAFLDFSPWLPSHCVSMLAPLEWGKDGIGGGEERKGEKRGEREMKDEQQEEGEKRRKERSEEEKEEGGEPRAWSAERALVGIPLRSPNYACFLMRQKRT